MRCAQERRSEVANRGPKAAESCMLVVPTQPSLHSYTALPRILLRTSTQPWIARREARIGARELGRQGQRRDERSPLRAGQGECAKSRCVFSARAVCWLCRVLKWRLTRRGRGGRKRPVACVLRGFPSGLHQPPVVLVSMPSRCPPDCKPSLRARAGSALLTVRVAPVSLPARRARRLAS
jgi:hypothetical protein